MKMEKITLHIIFFYFLGTASVKVAFDKSKVHTETGSKQNSVFKLGLCPAVTPYGLLTYTHQLNLTLTLTLIECNN